MFLWPFRLVIRIVALLVSIALVYVAVTLVQVWLTSRDDDPHQAQAVLVFGTAANYDSPAPDLLARLERALSLYDAHLAPLVVVTGGKLPADRYTEAQISAQWLEARGVPKTHVLLGGGSDTWENANSVADAMHALGVHSVLVVTDPFHEDRAMAIVSGFGFSVSPTPSLHSPIGGFSLVPYFLKEAVEVAAGRIVGYHALSDWTHS